MTRTKKIPPEVAFQYWYQFGNLEIACRVYYQDTGIEITRAGMHYAIDSWIIENPDKAKSLLYPDRLLPKYKGDWKYFLLRKLINRYRRANTMGHGRSHAFHNQIIRLGLENYSQYYADKFGETFGRQRSKRMPPESFP